MTKNEKLRKAIEWARQDVWEAAWYGVYLRLLADAAEHSIMFNEDCQDDAIQWAEKALAKQDPNTGWPLGNDIDRERLGKLVHMARLSRTPLDERCFAVPDDAEVREAVGRIHLLIHGSDNKAAWQIVRAAALSLRTRWYTVERDGMPEKTRACVWSNDTMSSLDVWHRNRPSGWCAPKWTTCYTYLDAPPVEEPLPECPWCNTEVRIVGPHAAEGWRWVCDYCEATGPVRTTREQTVEDLRNLRRGEK